MTSKPQTVAAITLHQPWASLIAAKAKPFETRSWSPPARQIGQRIAIHAGLHLEKRHDAKTATALAEVLGCDWVQTLPRGAVLCTATVAGAWQLGAEKHSACGRPAFAIAAKTGPSPDLAEVETDLFGDYRPGRWIWRLEQIELFTTPITARGYQKIWHWKCDLAA